MRRPLVTILSVASLALCTATSALWMRSFRTFDRFSADPFFVSAAGPRQMLVVVSSRGRLWVVDPSIRGPHEPGVAHVSLPVLYTEMATTCLVPPRLWPSRAMGWAPVRYGANAIEVSDLHVVSFAGLLPLAVLVRGRDYRRRLWKGKCKSCGYDMRATPNRCPECGALPKEAVVQPSP